MRKLVIRYLWKAHAVAVIILVAWGSLSVSRWAFQEMHWQRYTINETCLDNSNDEHPAEQCPFDDRTKELGLVVFPLMAVPAVVRFTKWEGKETYRKQCEASVRCGTITREHFYWSVAEHLNEAAQPPIPMAIRNAAFSCSRS